MSAFPTPVAWVTNEELTFGRLNARSVDPINWLKAALDNVTAGTISDVGTNTLFRVSRGGQLNAAFAARLTGDSSDRTVVVPAGIALGPGNASTDVSLRRRSSGVADLFSGNSAGLGMLVHGAIGAQVVRFDPQAINDNQWSSINFQEQRFDRANPEFWTSTSNTRLTVPYKGIYLATANASFAGNATGTYRGIGFNVNGNDPASSGTQHRQYKGSDAAEIWIEASQLILLDAGEFIACQVWHNGPSQLNLLRAKVGIVYLGGT